MARVSNARSSHVERWVVPAAREILIREACKDAPTKFLDEVAFLEMGQSPAGEAVNEDGEGTPFIGGPSDLGIEFPNTTRFTTTPNKLCQQDDIIVCVRATIGEPRWSDGVYALGRGVAGIRPKNSDIDRKFLFRIIQANERLLYEQGTGTTFKTITKDHLAKIVIPILPPKTQKAIGDFLAWLESHIIENPDFSSAPELPDFLKSRIVTIKIIEALAARIAKAQSLREEADKEISALSLSAYHQAFQAKDDWQVLKISDFCDNPQYGYTESAKYEPVGPRFLRITDIQDSRVDWDNVPYCVCPQPEKYLLKPKDIVFARTGATTGKSFLIQECPEAVFASYLIRLRLLHSVTPEYLYAFFQSPDYWSQITDEKKGTGQPNVNGQKLINVRVPVPPLDEQRRIVAYLDSVQARLASLRELQSATGEELSALMPSVLDKAFKGEL